MTDYPPKPEEITKQKTIGKSITSLFVFAFAFYVIFKWDYIYIVALIGVLIIHELGHYIAMKRFKYKDLSIFFIPLIGAAVSGEKENVTQKQNVIILLSGPIPGVIIGLFIYFMGLNENSDILIRVANMFIYINLFNLLPIIPLDGGRIIKCLFFEKNRIINLIFIWLSIIIITFFSLSLKSYFLLIIPFFLLIRLSAQSQANKIRKILSDKNIDYNKTYNELTDKEYWLLRDEIGVNIKHFNNQIEQKEYIESKNETKIINQVKMILNKKPIYDMKSGGKVLVIFIMIFMFLLPLFVFAFFMIHFGKVV